MAARELRGVSAEQLQHLGRFEVAMRLSLGPGAVTSTMTGTTEPMSNPSSDASAIRTLAATSFGTTLEDVDAELVTQLGLNQTGRDVPDEDGPVGARRRAS